MTGISIRTHNLSLLNVLAIVMIASTVGLISLENAYATPSYFYVKSVQTYITPGGFMDAPKGIARDATGNVYVADSGNDRIQEFDSTGNFIHAFGSTGASQGQFNSPNGIATDSSGNVYIVDTNNNRIEEFSSTGSFIRQFGGGFGNVVLNFPLGIFVNSTGYMYVADSSNNAVKILTTNGDVVQQIGPSIPGYSSISLNNPAGITIDSSGNILVVDSGHAKVVKFSKNGNYISSFGSLGSGNGQLSNPRGIGITSSGDILVGDSDNNRIVKFSSTGSWIANLAPAGIGNGQSAAPTFIATDPTGGFYFADTQNQRIQKLDNSGVFLLKWGSYAVNDFQTPNGVGIDSSGNIYVADTAHNYISKFDNTGNFLTGIGSPGLANGELDTPSDVNFDISGNLLVTNTNNDRVEAFTSSGLFQNIIGSNSLSGPIGVTRDSTGNIYVVDNGNTQILKFDSSGANPIVFADSTNFNNPSYIAINSTGYVFVTDSGTNQIKYFSSSGTPLGTFGSSGSGNGQLSNPQGIAIDSSGNILVADKGNNRIQVFDSHRNYLTQFGTTGTGVSQFNGPIGIALDNLGNVYVADSVNNRIEVFSASLPSASITISPVNPPTARWGLDTVTITGQVVNPALGNTVSINWGDGTTTSGVTITIAGTTGTWTATHTYPQTAVGSNNIVATLVNGGTNPTSSPVSVSITGHHTSITLSLQSASSLPWNATISVTGTLTDTDANVVVPSTLVTLTGSGVGTLANPTTASDGTFTGSGNSPALVSSTLTINAQLTQDHGYLSSNTASVTYQTLKHNTSLLLNPIPNVLPGAPITVSGSLLDIDASNVAVPSQTITFTGSGIGTMTTSVTTVSDGSFTSSGNAPSTVSTGLTVQANFAGDANYVTSSNTQSYSTLSQSISFSPSNTSAIWGIPLTLSGAVQNPATGDSVIIDWGDGGPISTATITITGTTGTWTATYPYPSTAVGTHNIVATLVNGVTQKASSSPVSVSITGHHTSITLSLQSASSLPWNAPISVTGTLTDTDASGPISSQVITFTGSGVGTLANPTTASDGTFTGSGNSPALVSSTLTINAQFVPISSAYLSSNTPSVTYQTLKHNTSVTLNPVSSVPVGATLSATGILIDTDIVPNVAVEQKTITYGGTGSPLFNTATTLTGNNGAFLTTVVPATPTTMPLQLQAIFAGDELYGQSSSQTQTFTIFPSGGIPTIAITSPFNGQTVNSTSITITGTASDSVSGVQTVQVQIDSGSFVTASTSDGYAHWSITTTITPGTHTITAKATNNGNNISTSSVSIISRPLSTPVITTPSTITNNPLQTMYGTGDSNVQIKVYNGNTLIGSTMSDSTGHWSLSVTLPSGTSTITANEVTTDATSSISNAITITVDTIPPTVAITSPANNAVLHTLTFNVNGTSTDSLSGVQKVEVKIDGGSYIVATGINSWSITTTITPGTHTITAKATDNAGNISTTSISITIKSSEGKVTGGGKIDKDTNFGFDVNSDDSKLKGQLEFKDKSANIDLHSTSMTFLSINPSSTNTYFLGTAALNHDNGYTFTVYVQDNGKPGKTDVFGINIYDSHGNQIYSKSGVLTSGNIQIHKSKLDLDEHWFFPSWLSNHEHWFFH